MVSARFKAKAGNGTSERGGASVFMIMTLMFLLLLAAVSTDLGHAFNAKRNATNIASAAARHGVNAVDADSLYSTGVADYDYSDALAAVRAAIPAHAVATRIDLDADAEEITVTVEIVHETILLKMIGIDSIDVAGKGTARVQNGPGS